MRITRRHFLLLLLPLAFFVAWPILQGIDNWLEKKDEGYSRIEDTLYMGAWVAQPPPGTQAVVNLCDAPEPYQTEQYLWTAIPDAEPAPAIDWLWHVVEFVDTQQRAGLTTYVHCASGFSRSGMVVVAYEMYRNNWSRDQALEFVRSKRPQTRPNPAFMELLLEWEAVLKALSADGGPQLTAAGARLNLSRGQFRVDWIQPVDALRGGGYRGMAQ